jgi:erythromycin esterase
MVTLAGPITHIDLPLTPAPSIPSKVVTDWIREHAVGLVSCDPNQAQDDLAPLAAMVGSAKVLAVGEACHGTREFTQLTHRLIVFLIEQLGFTAFGIEADPADTVALNAYILQGTGNPEQAVRELGFWTGPTREVLNLALWLRQYNANPAHPAKVSVFGIDPLLATMTPDQGIEGRNAREKAMAEQVQTIRRRMPAGSKVVVWVHNDHASKCLPEDWTGVEPMGWHLHEALGKDYLAVGTAFRRGTFLALDNSSHPKALETFTVPAHCEATLDAALAAIGKPLLVLDFRLIPAQGETATWFQTPQGTWRIGAEFSRAERQAHLCPMVAPKAFDLLFFVERTRPPRRLG